MNPRIISVLALDGYRLELGFTDGASGVVDLRERVTGRGGLFGALEDPRYFAQVKLDSEAGTVIWPNGVDLCPDVLYSLAMGKPIRALESATR